MDSVNMQFLCMSRRNWKCPPNIALSSDWYVASGEESEEAKAQKLWEKKMPRVLYQSLTYVPSNPFQADDLDESQIPLIPIIPIEETEALAAGDSSSLERDTHSQVKPLTTSGPADEAGSSTEADVALAAATVVSALVKSKELGNGIDTDMLVKILSDPKTVEKLISDVGTPSISKTQPVLDTKLLETSLPLASSEARMEQAFGQSNPNPGLVPWKQTEEYRVAVGKALDRRPVHIPGRDYLSSQFTFLSKPDSVVHISTSLPVMPVEKPLPSFPNSKPDLDEYKWTDNGYGVSSKTVIKSITRPNLFAPDVFIPSVSEDVPFQTRLNVYPLREVRQTDVHLQTLVSDFVRPTDSQLISASPGSSRVKPYLSSNQVQPGLEIGAPFLNPARPGLEISGPFLKQSEPGVPMIGLPAVNAQPPFLLPNASPQVRDRSYLKNLIQEHGEMHEPWYSSPLFYQPNTKQEPYFEPKVLASKIQRPCFFFYRPEGCKDGYSCPYVHNQPQNMQSESVMGALSSKRIKLDRDIFGIHG